MQELISSIFNTEIGRVSISAIIGACVAILSILMKDIILYELRERRKEKKALINRKLTQLYSPLYMVCITREGSISNLLTDDAIYKKLMLNMHLLSPKLQQLFNNYNSLCTGGIRKPEFSAENSKKAIEISNDFSSVLKKEMDELRMHYK